MLELRPCCECCGTDLGPNSKEALICSFECTFCKSCNDSTLKNICPNCGGDLVQRPTRAKKLLVEYPASSKRIVKEHGCDALG